MKWLCDIFQEAIFNMGLGEVKSHFIAQQIVSEVFVELWDYREKMNTIHDVEAYLRICLSFIIREKNEEVTMREFNISFELDGYEYEGSVSPSELKKEDGSPLWYSVHLNHAHFGLMEWVNNTWRINGGTGNPQLIQMVGQAIENKLKAL